MMGFRAKYKKIKEVRQFKGMTQADLAAKAKLSNSVISKVESKAYFDSGKGHSSKALRAVEVALDLDIGEAFDKPPQMGLNPPQMGADQASLGLGTGMSRPTSKNVLAEIPLRSRLLRHGITPTDDLKDERLLTRLDSRFAIGDSFLNSPINNYMGLPPHKLISKPATRKTPYPDYVLEARKSVVLKAGERNLPKVYLEDWRGAVGDQADCLTLFLGKTDYVTCKAVERSAPRIHQELKRGDRSLDEFPRMLVTPIVVITSDNKIVMARRAPGVGYNEGQWTASITETVEGEKDTDRSDLVRPEMAVRRALTEGDELNLGDVAESARLRFVAVATEWRFLVVNLITVAYLEARSEYVHEKFQRGENDAIDTIPFTIENGLKLIRDGMYAKEGQRTPKPITDRCRISLLASLFHHFGYNQVVSQLGSAIADK